MSQKRELGAIVFTDIADFTSMMDKDESKALKIRHQQRNSIQSILKDFDGEYIKEIGDGDLMMFQSATDAVHFTLRLQNDISPNDGFLIRAAIHIGDVVREGEDIFGAGVNMASRIHAFASPGSTVISESVFQEIKNKPEFSITSIGKKSVKGIDGTVQIHEVSFLQESTNKDIPEDVGYVEKSMMTDLFERRVPQFVGLYFAISWGIIQFINWVVDRYLLSPHLIDLSLAIVISMIPSVLVLSYFHGRPGKDKWNRIERIVVPANLIISVVLLVVFFYPKNLGAVTEDIVLTNEDGTEFTKTIIKSEFRKNLNVFNFENVSSDTSNNWMNKGIGLAIRSDLGQDLYITSKSNWASRIKKDIGYASKDNISLGDMQRISKRTSSEFFITGNHSFEHGVYTLNFKVYKTGNAKLINSHEYQGNNFFEIIDLATTQIKHDIGIPSYHIENTKDLPIAEKLTNSMSALKHYTIASYDTGIEEAFYHLNEAVKYDGEFAGAHLWLYSLCMTMQDMECFSHHMGLTKKYINKLNESTQFAVRIDEMEVMNPDMDRKLNLLNMWIELYPNDIRPLEYLAVMYFMMGDFENSILTNKKILQIDPSMHEYLLEIGNSYKAIPDYDNALIYFKKYQELNPNNPDGYQNIASVYMVQLDYENAYSYMLKAQAVGATGPDFELQLTNLNAKLNTWPVKQYVKEIERIIEQHPKASFRTMLGLYQSINQKLGSRGRLRESFSNQKKLIEYGTSQAGPGIGALFSVDMIHNKIILGDLEDGEKELNLLLEQLTMPPFSMLGPTMQSCYYHATKDWDKLNENIEAARDGAKAVGFNFMLPMLDQFIGDYYEDIGDIEKATEQYMKVIDSESMLGDQIKVGAYISQGRIYQELGLFKDSEKMFKTVMKLDDENAELFYEYSILKEKQGDKDEALDLIMKAYNLYKDADRELELTQKIFTRYESFQEQLP